MSETETSQGGTGQPTTGEGGLSVPIGVHIESLFRERDKLVVERLEGIKSDINHLEDMMKENRSNDQKAVKVALTEAKELAQKHNDLIQMGKDKDATYALQVDLTRLEKWQARLTGAGVLVGAVGITNFVRLFGVE